MKATTRHYTRNENFTVYVWNKEVGELNYHTFVHSHICSLYKAYLAPTLSQTLVTQCRQTKVSAFSGAHFLVDCRLIKLVDDGQLLSHPKHWMAGYRNKKSWQAETIGQV